MHCVGYVRPTIHTENVLFHRVSGEPASPALAALRTTARLASVVVRRGVRAIVCFGVVESLAAAPFRRVKGLRVATFLRNDFVETQRANGASRLSLAFARWIERRGSAARDTTVAVSRALAARVPGAVVLPNDAPPRALRESTTAARRRIGLPERAPVVGYAGPIEPIKSLETLVLAAADRPDLHVALMGFSPRRTPYESALLARVQSAGLVDRFHALPWRDDVRPFLDALDALVLPSLHEGCPNVLLEAMARAVPCLGARAAGIEEVLADDEALFPQGAPEILGERIAAILADVLLRGRIVGRASRRIDEYRFDWDARVVTLLEETFGWREAPGQAAPAL